MWHNRQRKYIPANYSLRNCSDKSLRTTWKSQEKLREFSHSKIWPPDPEEAIVRLKCFRKVQNKVLDTRHFRKTGGATRNHMLSARSVTKLAGFSCQETGKVR